jgi:hypothetical protein
MQLDVLSLDVGMTRWGGGEMQVCLKGTVVPADHDKIRLGERHTFAQHIFAADSTRVEAQVWITVDTGELAHANTLFLEKPRLCPVGFARASFPQDENDESATLRFNLFSDKASLDEVLRQVRQADAGSIRISLSIDGLKFGFPDEDIWEPEDGDGSTSSIRPISHFSIEVAKLRTTRGAIRAARDTYFNEELADSDDAKQRKLAGEWAKAASQEAAEQSFDPALAILRQCRGMLAILTVAVLLEFLARL